MSSASNTGDITLCLPTLFPDLGRSTDVHFAATVAAADRAGAAGLDLFASHLVQAIEAATAGGDPTPLVPPPNRRTAVPAFRAALLRAHEALQRPEAVAFRDNLAARGLAVHAVEVLSVWPTATSDAARAEAEAVCAVASFLRAPAVVAVCMDVEINHARAAANLALCADVAAAAGLRVLVEWLPGTAIPSWAAARSVVDATLRDNLGYVVDALHWQCQPGGPDWMSLRSAPPGSIGMIQLSDCRLPLVDGREPTTRLMPGAGDIALPELVSVALSTDARPLLAVEVFDEERLIRDGIERFALDQMNAARGVVAESRGRAR